MATKIQRDCILSERKNVSSGAVRAAGEGSYPRDDCVVSLQADDATVENWRAQGWGADIVGKTNVVDREKEEG